jgi:hypothetical protein
MRLAFNTAALEIGKAALRRPSRSRDRFYSAPGIIFWNPACWFREYPTGWLTSGFLDRGAMTDGSRVASAHGAGHSKDFPRVASRRLNQSQRYISA